MYVTIEVPDIPDYPMGFPSYWGKMVVGGTPSSNYQINALVGTYVRLVEAALIEYRLGAAKLHDFWNDHESFNIGAMSRSISHFETCLSDMHRATNCFRRLRRHKDPIGVMLNTEKATFATETAAKQLREMRNEINHLEEHVMHGRVKEGEPAALFPSGPEVPHPTEANQTIMSIDRLVIGSRELLFSELATLLREMGHFAEKIAAFSPSPLPGRK